MAYDKELKTAVEAVIKASLVCRKVQADIRAAGTVQKDDRSPVTEADFASQIIINRELLHTFPNDRIIGEEDASKLRTLPELKERVLARVRAVLTEISEKSAMEVLDKGKSAGGASGRYWAVDPIDGTKGFLRGEQYAIAVGLIENGKVVLGILGCPNLPYKSLAAAVPVTSKDNAFKGGKGIIAYAVLGEGAFVRNYTDTASSPLQVSDIKNPEDAWFVESVESAHSSQHWTKEISDFLGIKKPPIRIDSQAKYAAVARGDVPLYIRIPQKKGYIENIWDHAAGAIIVAEAGGKVTDIFGRNLDFSKGRKLTGNKGIIASNGTIHSAVIKAVAKLKMLESGLIVAD